MAKSFAVGPGLAISTVATWMVGAVLPPLAGLASFVGGVAIALTLALGAGEAIAARVLLASRPLRAYELEDLAPAVTRLCRASLGPPLVELRVRRGRGIRALGAGRRTVVVSSGLLEAVADGALPAEQAAAVIAHAAALVRDGWTRSDLLIAFWSIPWELFRAMAAAMAAMGRVLPLTALAWRLRAVPVAIAADRMFRAGHLAPALLIATLGAVSYAMPVAVQHWHRTLLHAGDAAMSRVDLATALATLLRRCPVDDIVRARLRALDPAPSVRVLGLVH